MAGRIVVIIQHYAFKYSHSIVNVGVPMNIIIISVMSITRSHALIVKKMYHKDQWLS